MAGPKVIGKSNRDQAAARGAANIGPGSLTEASKLSLTGGTGFSVGGQGTTNTAGSLCPVDVHSILPDAGGGGKQDGEQGIVSGAATMDSKDVPGINARGQGMAEGTA